MSDDYQFNDDQHFKVKFDHESKCGGMRLELEIVGYVEEIFLERLRSVVAPVEQSITSLPKE